MNRHAVWMIPTVNLLLFLVAGLLVGVLAVPASPRLALAASLFSYLGFGPAADVPPLSTSGRTSCWRAGWPIGSRPDREE